MDFNKQRFALNIGLLVMVFHIILSFLLWFMVEFPDERIAIREITLPLTIGYATSVVTYYVETGGRVTSTEVVGVRLVILFTTLIVIFMGSLIAAPIYYLDNAWVTPATLNSFFAFGESAFGGLMALIITFLFAKEKKASPGG